MSELSDRDEGHDDEDIKSFLSNAEVTVAPGVKWEDVCGIQEAVEKMKEYIILLAKFPQLFTGSRNPHSSALLLYGPPGTGKTLLVQAAIAELIPCNTLCYKVSAFELLSRWQKNPIKTLQAMFKKAEGCRHSVFFIDDIEELSRKYEGETELSAHLKTEFLTQVYNMRKNSACISYIVGITNKPWKLATDDNALLRVLVRRVYVPLPDIDARCAIFRQKLVPLEHALSDEHFRMFAERSAGFTGADIVSMARDACMQPIRKIQAATHFKQISGPSAEDPKTMVDLLAPCPHDDPGALEMTWLQIEEDNKLFTPAITVDDVMKSLSDHKPSVSKEELDMYQKFTEDFGPMRD